MAEAGFAAAVKALELAVGVKITQKVLDGEPWDDLAGELQGRPPGNGTEDVAHAVAVGKDDFFRAVPVQIDRLQLCVAVPVAQFQGMPHQLEWFFPREDWQPLGVQSAVNQMEVSTTRLGILGDAELVGDSAGHQVFASVLVEVDAPLIILLALAS